METSPLVRRRPREEDTPQPDAPSRQTYAIPTVLLITEDAGFLIPEFSAGTLIWRWDADTHGTKASSFGGDPTDPATYAFIADVKDVSAIVALADPRRSQAVAAALQQANCETAVLVIGDAPLEDSTTGPRARLIDWRAAVRSSLETELQRLETMKRVAALREFAEGAEVVPILLHHDPDPDAVASAFAIRVLLRRNQDDAPILTLDEMTRPENRRMAELLDIRVTQVTRDELLAFDRIICTDMQPRDFTGQDAPRLAVIDHHPPENGYCAEYIDIRPSYGATATMLTEYLRCLDERFIGKRLATALVYAIKTDTDNMTRGVSAADVEAYTFLLERADSTLLRLIERPSYAERSARAYGRGIAEMQMRQDLAVTFLGEMPADDSHILADVADFCLAMDEATWAVAGAVVDNKLVINIRHLGADPGAGDLASAIARKCGGSGGGHSSMARAVLPLKDEWGALKDAPPDQAREILLEQLSANLTELR